jgi:hypothetical protein
MQAGRDRAPELDGRRRTWWALVAGAALLAVAAPFAWYAGGLWWVATNPDPADSTRGTFLVVSVIPTFVALIAAVGAARVLRVGRTGALRIVTLLGTLAGVGAVIGVIVG